MAWIKNYKGQFHVRKNPPFFFVYQGHLCGKNEFLLTFYL